MRAENSFKISETHTLWHTCTLVKKDLIKSKTSKCASPLNLIFDLEVVMCNFCKVVLIGKSGITF